MTDKKPAERSLRLNVNDSLLDRAVRGRKPAAGADDPDAIATKSYKIRNGTAARIREIAANYDVGIGDLVDFAISAALDSIEAGELELPLRRVEVTVLDRGKVGRPSARRLARERQNDKD
jgi:hypothetical protein